MGVLKSSEQNRAIYSWLGISPTQFLEGLLNCSLFLLSPPKRLIFGFKMKRKTLVRESGISLGSNYRASYRESESD